MNLPYNVSCWQLRRYGGAIYSRLVEISSSDVPDTACCRLPELCLVWHSRALEPSAASGFWWPGSVRTHLTEATTNNNAVFASFAVKTTCSGSRSRNRSAHGGNLLYCSFLFNAVVFFSVRAREAVQVFICNSNPNEMHPEWLPLLTVHLLL